MSPLLAPLGLIGLPDDLGVRLNGGRPGAAAGPAALRVALERLGWPDPKIEVRPGTRLEASGGKPEPFRRLLADAPPGSAELSASACGT